MTVSIDQVVLYNLGGLNFACVYIVVNGVKTPVFRDLPCPDKPDAASMTAMIAEILASVTSPSGIAPAKPRARRRTKAEMEAARAGGEAISKEEEEEGEDEDTPVAAAPVVAAPVVAAPVVAAPVVAAPVVAAPVVAAPVVVEVVAAPAVVEVVAAPVVVEAVAAPVVVAPVVAAPVAAAPVVAAPSFAPYKRNNDNMRNAITVTLKGAVPSMLLTREKVAIVRQWQERLEAAKIPCVLSQYVDLEIPEGVSAIHPEWKENVQKFLEAQPEYVPELS